jgi:hypothetical protein
MFSNTVNVSAFSNTPSLSAKYPPINNVVPALDYAIASNNKINVTYPAPQTPGTINIIIFNDAGYAGILPNGAL